MYYRIYKLSPDDKRTGRAVHSERDIRDAIDYVARLEHPDTYCILKVDNYRNGELNILEK